MRYLGLQQSGMREMRETVENILVRCGFGLLECRVDIHRDNYFDPGPFAIRGNFQISPEILDALSNAPQSNAWCAGRSDSRKLLLIYALPFIGHFQDDPAGRL